MLAGFIALAGAIYSGRTFALSRRGQITERFTRAIDHLGSDKVQIRLGGIYALERIAHESADEHVPIMEILTAYVRETSTWPPPAPRTRPAADGEPPRRSAPDEVHESPDHDAPLPPTGVDIKEILAVLSRRAARDERERAADFRIELTGTNLRDVRANGIDLRRAQLSFAQLPWADLRGARLQDAVLVGADLWHADLDGVQLQRANLTSARLQEADLHGAPLQDARLSAIQLQYADLREAQLQGADMTGAQLQDARLDRALLQGANLLRAQLQRASLVGAQLQGANLRDAELQDADLTDAVCDRATTWSAGLPWRAAGVKLEGE
jgi:hypothetical protein